MARSHRDQCPFVDQPDGRCAQRLSIERLEYAFGFCFDEYDCCPVYLDRLLEDRLKNIRANVIVDRQPMEPAHGPTFVQLTTPKTPGPATAA